MVVKTTTVVTQKYGARRPNGNIPAEITYDDIRVDGSMNGQPVPGANPGTMLIGKTLAITYDRDGNVADTQVPSETALPAEAFKRLLNSAYGNLPTAPIGIGEVVIAPLDFTLPLPVPGSPPLKMEGTVKLKLASIDQTSSGRIAKFESTVDATLMNTLEMPSPNGTLKMAMDFKMSGGGTTLKDVEKGLVRSSEDISNFEGKIKLDQSGPGPLPNMSMKGIIKVSLKATN